MGNKTYFYRRFPFLSPSLHEMFAGIISDANFHSRASVEISGLEQIDVHSSLLSTRNDF